MNKKKIIAITICVVLLALSVTFVEIIQSKAYNSKKNKVDTEINQVQAQLDKLKEDKDVNSFLPTDVVKYFVFEIKNGSNKPKLYVTSEKQNSDLVGWLKIEGDPSLISIQNVNYDVIDSEAVVSGEISYNDKPETFFKNFTLIKENGEWKISEIN